MLDISRNASEDEIKAAYKRIARRWHPDRHVSGKETAAQKFIEGHDAYRRLMEKKRSSRHSKRSRTASNDKGTEVAAAVPSNPRQSTSSANVDTAATGRQSDSPATHAKSEKRASSSRSSHRGPLDVESHSAPPSPSRSSRRASGSKKASSELNVDDALPRPKSEGAHSMPSSPKPTHHKSVSSHAGDNSGPQETTTPDSPKTPTQPFGLSSMQSGSPPTHSTPVDAKAEKRSLSLESCTRTLSNVSSKLASPLPSGSSGHRTSESNKLPLEPNIDSASPRPKTVDAPSTPSSPEPLQQPILSTTGSKSASDAREATHPDSPKSPAQRPRSRLQRRRPNSDSRLDRADDDSGYVYITTSKDIPTEPNGHDAGHHNVDGLNGKPEAALRPVRTPSSSSMWLFPLELTLEELFHGTSLHFRITSRLLSRNTKQSLVAVDIPPGTLAGTKIRCPGVGHERTDGTHHDVVLVVEEKTHDRFQRVKDDLFLDVFVPCANQLGENNGDILIEGIDGTRITVNIPYPVDQRFTEGKVVVKGAGMPFREGRGDLIVRYV